MFCICSYQADHSKYTGLYITALRMNSLLRVLVVCLPGNKPMRVCLQDLINISGGYSEAVLVK